MKMEGFTGVVKLKIIEAMDLEQVAVRSQVVTSMLTNIEPYIRISVDDEVVAKTTTKAKGAPMIWNEDFSESLQNAKSMTIMIFHSTYVGEGTFVAEQKLSLSDIMDEEQPDLWVRQKNHWVSDLLVTLYF